MSKKRQQQGEGWTFVPANAEESEPALISIPPQQQKAKILLEKRKKGKIVTVVDRLILSEDDLKALAKSLKVFCGTGGTARDGQVELQGDCREKVRRWMGENGWGFS